METVHKQVKDLRFPRADETALTALLQDTGCIPRVRVFGWPGSVFGARCSALGVDSAPVPGTRSRVPGSQDPHPSYPASCILYPASMS